MRRLFLSALAIVLLTGAGFSADDWKRYLNPRYGYGVDIPASFAAIREADNGDGGTSRSDDGQATLAVWGGNLLLDTLASDVQNRIQGAVAEEWEISYQKITNRWASWSGEREGRIFYARAILLCHDDEAGYFQLQYPVERRDEFDAIVKRLVKGFTRIDCQ